MPIVVTLLRPERSREVICTQKYKKRLLIVVTPLRPEKSRVICEQRDKNLSPIVVTSEMCCWNLNCGKQSVWHLKEAAHRQQ